MSLPPPLLLLPRPLRALPGDAAVAAACNADVRCRTGDVVSGSCVLRFFEGLPLEVGPLEVGPLEVGRLPPLPLALPLAPPDAGA